MRKGSLQSLVLPEAKRQEVGIDFMIDLPTDGDAEESIMTVVDCATKIVHLIPCRTTITAD